MKTRRLFLRRDAPLLTRGDKKKNKTFSSFVRHSRSVGIIAQPCPNSRERRPIMLSVAHPQKKKKISSILTMTHAVGIDSRVPPSVFPPRQLFTGIMRGQECIMRRYKRVNGSPERKGALSSINEAVTIRFQSTCSKPSAFKERT